MSRAEQGSRTLYSRAVRADNCSAVLWDGPKLVEHSSCCENVLFGQARLHRSHLDGFFGG